jgi:molybdate transport system permease protein
VRRIPLVLLVPAMLALAFLALPVVALLSKVSLSELPERLRDPLVLDALRLSLVTSTISTVLCVLLGVPLAWVMARKDVPLRRLMRVLVVLPLVLPPVAGGLSLLLLFGPDGVGGRLLESLGLGLPATTAGVIVAQTFVALPFLVLATEGAIRSVDPRMEGVAATLGASQWQAFRRVTLPLAMPGVVAGVVLAWARALGEFGATVTFAGSVPGRTETLPLVLSRALKESTAAGVTVGVVLLVLSAGVLLLLRDRWWSLS